MTNRVRLVGACATCGIRGLVELDHIVAICNGGKHEVENLQYLCFACHGRKTKADIRRFYGGDMPDVKLGRPARPSDERVLGILSRYGVLTASMLNMCAGPGRRAEVYSTLEQLVEEGVVMESRALERPAVYYIANSADKTLGELFPPVVLEEAEAA